MHLPSVVGIRTVDKARSTEFHLMSSNCKTFHAESSSYLSSFHPVAVLLLILLLLLLLPAAIPPRPRCRPRRCCCRRTRRRPRRCYRCWTASQHLSWYCRDCCHQQNNYSCSHCPATQKLAVLKTGLVLGPMPCQALGQGCPGQLRHGAWTGS